MAAAATASLLTSLAATASPAAAEESHTSCAAVRTVFVPLAQSGGAGDYVSGLATAGDLAAANAALRAANCEPKP